MWQLQGRDTGFSDQTKASLFNKPPWNTYDFEGFLIHPFKTLQTTIKTLARCWNYDHEWDTVSGLKGSVYSKRGWHLKNSKNNTKQMSKQECTGHLKQKKIIIINKFVGRGRVMAVPIREGVQKIGTSRLGFVGWVGVSGLSLNGALQITGAQ